MRDNFSTSIGWFTWAPPLPHSLPHCRLSHSRLNWLGKFTNRVMNPISAETFHVNTQSLYCHSAPSPLDRHFTLDLFSFILVNFSQPQSWKMSHIPGWNGNPATFHSVSRDVNRRTHLPLIASILTFWNLPVFRVLYFFMQWFWTQMTQEPNPASRVGFQCGC